MADSILRDKSKVFSKDIVFLCREIKLNHKEAVLANQLLKSGTSIGANLHEAQYAQSTNDFISKLEIAQKECYETEYWLELLFETDCIEEEKYNWFWVTVTLNEVKVNLTEEELEERTIYEEDEEEEEVIEDNTIIDDEE